MPDNEALWLENKRGCFAVGPAPDAKPGAGEIAVRVNAVAVNPFERLIRTVGDIIVPWLRYPTIVGTDVAGEVIAIGAGVSRFALGDRVIGFAAGSERGHRSAEGAFQRQVILRENLTAPIPDMLSYTSACVLPLAITTAAASLFQPDQLGLQPPREHPAPLGQTLLVWGGSTSVGCNAIQLAVAAGYDVIATASSHNHEYLRRLGARAVFDRTDPDVIAVITADLRGRRTCGAIAIGTGSARACIDVIGASNGNRFVAMATPPASLDDVPAGRGRWRKLLPVLASIVAGNAALALRSWRKGVGIKFIWGGSPVGNEVGPMIFADFLPAALVEKRYVAAPEASVIGEGLAAIPGALELQRLGVSASKLVIKL